MGTRGGELKNTVNKIKNFIYYFKLRIAREETQRFLYNWVFKTCIRASRLPKPNSRHLRWRRLGRKSQILSWKCQESREDGKTSLSNDEVCVDHSQRTIQGTSSASSWWTDWGSGIQPENASSRCFLRPGTSGEHTEISSS